MSNAVSPPAEPGVYLKEINLIHLPFMSFYERALDEDMRFLL
jgi:hypothetical protein